MAENDSMIGLKVGHYVITQKLGQGGMGVVYQAHHSTIDRVVAIKFLASQFSSDKEYIERFLQEAQAAAYLRHPNIISVFDIGAIGGNYYFVMEYIKGRDLMSFLKDGEIFEEGRAIQLVQRVASALSYAHGEGIIHQDIKPENLFLTEQGQIKIGDLGLASLMMDRVSLVATPGVALGTPAYISPEQICDRRTVDWRTDIYSLGATFYHLVTGYIPFPGATPEEVMTKHLNEPFPWPQLVQPGLSEALCQVLVKMMQKNMGDRYQNMDEVIAALSLIEAALARTNPQPNGCDSFKGAITSPAGAPDKTV